LGKATAGAAISAAKLQAGLIRVTSDDPGSNSPLRCRFRFSTAALAVPETAGERREGAAVVYVNSQRRQSDGQIGELGAQRTSCVWPDRSQIVVFGFRLALFRSLYLVVKFPSATPSGFPVGLLRYAAELFCWRIFDAEYEFQQQRWNLYIGISELKLCHGKPSSASSSPSTFLNRLFRRFAKG